MRCKTDGHILSIIYSGIISIPSDSDDEVLPVEPRPKKIIKVKISE